MILTRRRALSAVLALLTASLVFYSCRHERNMQEIAVDDGGYPPEVNRIFMLHCMTGAAGGGCHNAAGAENSNGLRMDTWDYLFNGTNHGATVIPYDTLNSSLLHYINIDSTLGAISLPIMPLNQTPLSRADYLTIRSWIAAGAPDKAGNIPFGDQADTRQKIYLTNQGSDVLSVIDAGRHVVMRNIAIGQEAKIESPHCVRLSADGKYAYVSFYSGDYVQKIDTRTDKVVGQVKISDGDAQWNILHVSDDGSKLIVSDLSRGFVRIISTATMTVTGIIGDENSGSVFKAPHGIDANADFDTIYMTGQYGNTVYKFTPDVLYRKYISIDGAPSQYSVGTRDPHEIKLTPDGKKYFLTCEASAEVRVMDAHVDTIVAVISVPTKPQELALSRSKPYMFVTCMEAPSTVAGAKGAVIVINYQTMQIVKTIYGNFWQPHGITVDDAAGTFYVASTNIGGPFTGHNHTSAAGQSGWYNVYDLNTLEPIIARSYETLVQPYSADTRIKP